MYEFSESQPATVELVTLSKFEAARINIQGQPIQLPDGHPKRFASLTLPGPGFPGKEGTVLSRSLMCSAPV